jgi:hypothetical protein
VTIVDRGDCDGHRGRGVLERRIGFGALEGIIGITTLCTLRLSEPMQPTEVMSFEGFGEIAQELEEFSGRLVGQPIR